MVVSGEPAPTRIVLSHPLVTSRFTCAGLWALLTRAPEGTDGDQDTAVTPTGCEPGSCRRSKARETVRMDDMARDMCDGECKAGVGTQALQVCMLGDRGVAMVPVTCVQAS